MTIYGTCYFVSKNAAISYYSEYQPSSARSRVAVRVNGKLAQGEIRIGRPPLRAGEELTLLDGMRRYGIREP